MRARRLLGRRRPERGRQVDAARPGGRPARAGLRNGQRPACPSGRGVPDGTAARSGSSAHNGSTVGSTPSALADGVHAAPPVRRGARGAHRRALHRGRDLRHPRTGGALRRPHRAPRPGRLPARRGGVRPRPGCDDRAGRVDHRRAPRADTGGPRPGRRRPLPRPRLPLPGAARPPAPGPRPRRAPGRPRPGRAHEPPGRGRARAPGARHRRLAGAGPHDQPRPRLHRAHGDGTARPGSGAVAGARGRRRGARGLRGVPGGRVLLGLPARQGGRALAAHRRPRGAAGRETAARGASAGLGGGGARALQAPHGDEDGAEVLRRPRPGRLDAAHQRRLPEAGRPGGPRSPQAPLRRGGVRLPPPVRVHRRRAAAAPALGGHRAVRPQRVGGGPPRADLLRGAPRRAPARHRPQRVGQDHPAGVDRARSPRRGARTRRRRPRGRPRAPRATPARRPPGPRGRVAPGRRRSRKGIRSPGPVEPAARRALRGEPAQGAAGVGGGRRAPPPASS